MTDENTFRFLLIGISMIQIAISVRYVRMAGAGSTIFGHREEGLLFASGSAVFYLAYLVSVLAYFIHPASMAWSAVASPAWLRWIGIAPLLIGAYLLVSGLHHLGTNLTISISTKDEHSLITTGPFRWVRHPLYAGGMIETVGLCLLISNWFVFLSAFLFRTMIAIRTPIEERELIEKFGDECRRYR